MATCAQPGIDHRGGGMPLSRERGYTAVTVPSAHELIADEYDVRPSFVEP